MTGSDPRTARAQHFFAHEDTQLLEALAAILPRYLHTADMQMVLHELRSRLQAGIDQPKLEAMHRLVQRCRRCAGVEANPQLPLWNLADPDAVFVGSLPATAERHINYLADALKRARFTSRRVTYTSLIRCRPTGTEAYATEADNCAGYLFGELQVLQPKLIVPLGPEVTERFIGALRITEEHGKVFWVGPWAIMPLYSLAHVVRAQLEAAFESDLARAFRFVYGDQP